MDHDRRNLSLGRLRLAIRPVAELLNHKRVSWSAEDVQAAIRLNSQWQVAGAEMRSEGT
jgi:hypothetical protein